jgi:hypothetical protein
MDSVKYDSKKQFKFQKYKYIMIILIYPVYTYLLAYTTAQGPIIIIHVNSLLFTWRVNSYKAKNNNNNNNNNNFL